MIKEISIRTQKRNELIDVTSLVEAQIAGVSEGLVTIYVPHTTAAVIINEGADPSVADDILNKLSQLVPYSDNYSHLEGNSDAHIKASLVGSSVSVIISNGRLKLGRWQSIFFCEFDGPRKRKIFLKW